MKKVLQLYTFCLLSLYSCSMKTTLTENEFAEKWIKNLKTKKKGLKLIKTNGLELHTEFNGKEFTYFLYNAYADYKIDPSDLDGIIDNHTKGSLNLFKPKEPINPSRIVPIIKDNRYLDELLRLNEQDTVNLIESYNDELVIVYAEDKEETINYFAKKDFEKLEFATDTLRNYAISNLNSVLPNIEINGNDGLYLIVAGGNYEASLILKDDIWTKENFPVKGEFLIGVPSRDMLLITGSKDIENIKKLKGIVAEIDNSGSYLISNKLFIRNKGVFEVVDL